MDKKSLPSPPTMPPTSAHYQTPVPGPTTAQMIEGNVYNIIVVLFDNNDFGLKCAWSVNFTWAHTLIPPNMSQCNVSFFLQIFLVLDQKSCLAVQLLLRLLDQLYIYTYRKGASLAANMLQMGQIYGQVSQSSTSAATPQPSHTSAPFYESAGQNRNEGWKRTISE